MCPFKRYKQREIIKPWLTPEIYREIRYREKCLELFRITGNQHYFRLACKSRNKVNALIDRAKSNYFRNILNANAKNPKIFWRLIKNFTDNSANKNTSSEIKDPITNVTIPPNEVPDYLNAYFVNIVDRLGITAMHRPNLDFDNLYDLDVELCFSEDLPSNGELLYYIENIDMTKSSGVPDINIKQCVDLLTGITDIICCIYITSLRTCIFPSVWSKGIVTLIPKPGDLCDPGNWRPITQTSVFSKLFEKIVFVTCSAI